MLSQEFKRLKEDSGKVNVRKPDVIMCESLEVVERAKVGRRKKRRLFA